MGEGAGLFTQRGIFWSNSGLLSGQPKQVPTDKRSAQVEWQVVVGGHLKGMHGSIRAVGM